LMPLNIIVINIIKSRGISNVIKELFLFSQSANNFLCLRFGINIRYSELVF
jgi:hypothetical protein